MILIPYLVLDLRLEHVPVFNAQLSEVKDIGKYYRIEFDGALEAKKVLVIAYYH